ncbi:ATP-binding protein [Leucobacter sp. HY1910]
MAKKDQAAFPQVPTLPQWETRSKVPLADGRIPGIDNSMWLYRSVPMSSITDAKSVEEAIKGGSGLNAAFEQLAELATPGINRPTTKNSYREFHVLLLNVPTWYKAPAESKIRDYLNTEFRRRLVIRRELLIGVRLIPNASGTAKGGWKERLKTSVESVTHTIVHGGTLLENFDQDTQLVSGALARAGMHTPSAETLRWADSWWNRGLAKAIPVNPHDNHFHFFSSMDAKRRIDRDFDVADCEHWPKDLTDASMSDGAKQHAVTFAAANDFTLSPTAVSEPIVRWASELIDQHARVISIRGLVEPASTTRAQIRSQAKRIREDIGAFTEKNKDAREEMKELQQNLDELEPFYASGNAPCTLHDCSIIVGFDGIVDDLTRVSPRALELNPLTNLQPAAFYETMLCSSVRANPLKQDLPCTTVAYSGLPNLSRVGDADGALMGFTERDGQPVYISNAAASATDAFPISLVAAGTGAGKTALLQWLAHQWGLMGIPQVIVDPKRDSDLGPAVEASGGRVFSFDEFVHSDGALDPLRFASDPTVGAGMAANMISQVRPFDSYTMQQHETTIMYAIHHGVSKGARATGQALRIAQQDGIIDEQVVDGIFRLAEAAPMFRACFGINPEGESLSVSNGITLFKVGKTQFELPQANTTFNPATANPLVRTSVNIIQMMVRGAMMSLTGRAGVLHIDEGWVLQQAAPDELEQIGRLSRSQNVLPMIYTQTPSGPLDAGMGNFISRGMVGHIKDQEEALAGMQLFGAVSEELIGRVSEMEYLSGGAGVNWNSLKALWHLDEETGKRQLLRPAVFYHSDLKNAIAPVEVHIPPSFFELASTNPEDVRRRTEQAERRAVLARGRS